MKIKTRKKICICILWFNFLLLLGYVGGLENGVISINTYLWKTGAVLACSIIPSLKLGIKKFFQKSIDK